MWIFFKAIAKTWSCYDANRECISNSRERCNQQRFLAGFKSDETESLFSFNPFTMTELEVIIRFSKRYEQWSLFWRIDSL